MPDLSGLVRDQRFTSLDPVSQRAVLGGIDPRFGNLSDADLSTFSQRLGGPPLNVPGMEKLGRAALPVSGPPQPQEVGGDVIGATEKNLSHAWSSFKGAINPLNWPSGLSSLGNVLSADPGAMMQAVSQPDRSPKAQAFAAVGKPAEEIMHGAPAEGFGDYEGMLAAAALGKKIADAVGSPRGVATLKGAAHGASESFTKPIDIQVKGANGPQTVSLPRPLLIRAAGNVVGAGIPLLAHTIKGGIEGFRGYTPPSGWTPPVFGEPTGTPGWTPAPKIQPISPVEAFPSQGQLEGFTEPGPVNLPPPSYPVKVNTRVPVWQGIKPVDEPLTEPAAQPGTNPISSPDKPIAAPRPVQPIQPLPTHQPGDLVLEGVPSRYSAHAAPRAAFEADKALVDVLKKQGVTPEKFQQSTLADVNKWRTAAGKKPFRTSDPNVAARLQDILAMLQGQ